MKWETENRILDVCGVILGLMMIGYFLSQDINLEAIVRDFLPAGDWK